MRRVLEPLGRLIQYRDLLWMWTLREIRVRYKQSVVGGLWAILQPLALMIVFTVVFSLLVKVPTDGIPYPIFSYAGLLPWMFFSTSVGFAVPSLVNNMDLVTKIYFPREILPMAAVGAALLDFAIASIIFAGLMLVYRVALSWTILWVPLLLGIQIALTLGLVLLMSAVNVFYRDVRFVIPLLLQIWMYATPIIYPVTLVPPRFRGLYALNPMVGLIDGYRRVAVLGEPPWWGALAVSAIAAAAILAGGYAIFKRSEAVFADVI
jgi:lipopolysaccharide transport system permease protein